MILVTLFCADAVPDRIKKTLQVKLIAVDAAKAQKIALRSVFFDRKACLSLRSTIYYTLVSKFFEHSAPPLQVKFRNFCGGHLLGFLILALKQRGRHRSVVVPHVLVLGSFNACGVWRC